MKVSLPMLLDKLNHYDCEYFKKAGENSDAINSVKLLNGNKESFDPEVLYVSKASYLSKTYHDSRPLNILCIQDSSAIPDKINNQGSNLIILKNDLDVMKIFEEAQDIITGYNQWSDRLLTALVQGKGLQDIVDIGHELIGNPIVITDTSLKVLGYTRNDEVDEDIWRETISKGYVSIYGARASNELKKALNTVNKSETPVLFELDSVKYPLLCTRIS